MDEAYKQKLSLPICSTLLDDFEGSPSSTKELYGIANCEPSTKRCSRLSAQIMQIFDVF